MTTAKANFVSTVYTNNIVDAYRGCEVALRIRLRNALEHLDLGQYGHLDKDLEDIIREYASMQKYMEQGNRINYIEEPKE